MKAKIVAIPLGTKSEKKSPNIASVIPDPPGVGDKIVTANMV